MLKNLRRRITALAALLTGAVVLAVCLAAFAIARREYLAGREGEFTRAVVSAASLWQDGALDFRQLSALEAASDILVYMEADGAPLAWVNVHPARAGLFAAALDAAEVENQLYALRHGGTGYRAVIRQGGNGRLLCVVQQTADEAAYLAMLALGFAGLALAGVVLVTLLCWVVAGRAIRPAAAAQKAQREFIAAAGHELRTPLTVLTTGFERVESEPSPRVLQLMQGETARMGRLVEDLLLLADDSSARWRLEKTGQDAVTLLLDAAEAMEPQAHARGLRLTVCVPEQALPPLRADGARVGQMLAVLLDNALRYAPAGSAVRLALAQAGGGLTFEVADSGPGVPDAEKQRIFERFYRSEAGRGGGHFGLGLSVAAELARLHGGRLSVHDTPGGGATFRLWLPLE